MQNDEDIDQEDDDYDFEEIMRIVNDDKKIVIKYEDIE